MSSDTSAWVEIRAMNEQPPAILSQLSELATRFSGRQAQPEERVYADLDINGSDFIDFVEEVEHLFGVDLSWVSPRDRRTQAQDPTIAALAENVMHQSR